MCGSNDSLTDWYHKRENSKKEFINKISTVVINNLSSEKKGEKQNEKYN